MGTDHIYSWDFCTLSAGLFQAPQRTSFHFLSHWSSEACIVIDNSFNRLENRGADTLSCLDDRVGKSKGNICLSPLPFSTLQSLPKELNPPECLPSCVTLSWGSTRRTLLWAVLSACILPFCPWLPQPEVYPLKSYCWFLFAFLFSSSLPSW